MLRCSGAWLFLLGSSCPALGRFLSACVPACMSLFTACLQCSIAKPLRSSASPAHSGEARLSLRSAIVALGQSITPTRLLFPPFSDLFFFACGFVCLSGLQLPAGIAIPWPSPTVVLGLPVLAPHRNASRLAAQAFDAWALRPPELPCRSALSNEQPLWFQVQRSPTIIRFGAKPPVALTRSGVH